MIYFSLLLVMLTGWQYAHTTYDSLARVNTIVMGWDQRPYVYRALVPALSRALTETGLPNFTALETVIVTFSVLLFYCMWHLLRSPEHAALCTSLFPLIFYYEHTVYDLATAALFALMFVYLSQGKIYGYCFAYAFSCVNRETTILMVTVFAAYMYIHMDRPAWLLAIAIQLIVYVGVRLYIMNEYSINSGVPFIFRPMENVYDFVHNPVFALLHWLGIGLVVYVCTRDWYRKPDLARLSFILLGIPLMLLYILFGRAFEIRVFAELYPVVVALMVGVKNVRSY